MISDIKEANTIDCRLQIFFSDDSRVNRISYIYDDGEEQDQKCSLAKTINKLKNKKDLDCNNIYSGYITTAFTVNRHTNVTFKVYDEAGNSSSYKTRSC